MAQSATYPVQAVARATGIPARRLQGWVERGVVVATEPARGTGTRTRFSSEDALRVAILAEIQRLFGSSRGLRPGGVAAQILGGGNLLTLAHIDTAMRLAIQGSASKQDDASGRLRLYLYMDDKGRGAIGASRKSPDEFSKTRGVLLLIDPVEVWRKIESRLTT